MKLARFTYKSKQYWGKIEGRKLRVIEGGPFCGIKVTRQLIPLHSIKLLPPAEPTKIILSGLNYKAHARELKMKIPKEPVIFLKPVTALVGHLDNIVYPEDVKRLDYEAELAVVIKKTGRSILESRVNEYILGYTCLNDVTARDLQIKDGQWTRAKSFDTFCPLGPWIETEINPDNLRIRSYLNGKLKQDSTTADFIFPLKSVVSFISKIMNLCPGGIISTGTPVGVGRMKHYDIIDIEIEGIGKLSNKIIPSHQ